MIRFTLLCLSLALPGLACAQAIKPPVPARSFTEAEIAAVAMQEMAFTETPAIADDYEKYFYFHRPDTSFDQAFADISQCDEMASGITYSAGGGTYYSPYGGVLGGALAGAIGSAMADAIFGSAERRRIRRINLRNCMGFKGYDRYGLEKGLWEQFHFEGSTVEPEKRQMFLKIQARVASGPAPTTKVLALAALIAATPAAAQPVEEKNLLSGKAKILPDSGYIFLNGPLRQNGIFLRLPDAQTVTEYEARWAEALDKEKKRYTKAYKRWQTDVITAKQTKQKLPEEPIKPTEANFSIGAIEMMNPVSFGPQFVFSKAGDGAAKEFSYLTAVKPGTYVYYGPIFTDPNGSVVGACYCMGSVKFEVKPGVITDLGNFLLVAPGADKDFPKRELVGAEMGLYQPQELGKQFGPLRYGVPASLKAYPYALADFRAQGALGNYYGITVSRMPPVDGVLAYDRDKVIDVKAATASINTSAN
jgi:hypothetical protein